MYTGFNWLDSVVGRNGAGAQAASGDRTVDFEVVSIFASGRGIAAQSPLPPISGYREAGRASTALCDWVGGARGSSHREAGCSPKRAINGVDAKPCSRW
jgi:hypothetical protein